MAARNLPAGFALPTNPELLESIDVDAIAEILAPENRDRMVTLLSAQTRADVFLREESAAKAITYVCVSPANEVQLVRFERDRDTLGGGVQYLELWTFGRLED